MNKEILEKYSVKIYKIDPYFVNIKKKEYKLTKMEYILFRIDVYFTE